MEKLSNSLRLILISLIIVTSLIIFKNWFFAKEIIGGDWPYFFNGLLKEFNFFAPSWVPYEINGFGGQIISYPLTSYLYFVVAFFVNTLHISWVVAYKVFFFGLFIFLSIFSSILLISVVIPQSKLWQKSLAAIIYTTNTYILMLVGGGQMGVALAYSVSPLVLASFMKLIDFSDFSRPNFKLPILAGLVLALQIMFDARIAYLTSFAVLAYLLIEIFQKEIRLEIKRSFFLLIPFGIAVLLHSSWILPLILLRSNPLDNIVTNYSSAAGFTFLSFADFSQSLSLLHPNWPENIFGKIYFMRPEFLLLPILAYISLLFVKNSKSRIQNNVVIIFFALLGLFGAFLAKGTNPPFGEVNSWLFTHMPFFSILRDPTKFYLFTALSYTVLIPFSISAISNQIKFKTHLTFLLFALFYLLFLLRPAVFGELGGTFAKHEVPADYIALRNFLDKKPEFFRTLWVPRQSRFAYYSNTHPSVEAAIYLNATNAGEMVHAFQADTLSEKLSKAAIKYVIVPYDSLGEIFVKDRKYDDAQYEQMVSILDHTKWLKKVDGFQKLALYEVPNPNGHFYFPEPNQNTNLDIKQLSTTSYVLSYKTDKPVNLVFSENYSPYWKVKIENTVLASEKSTGNFNVFRLTQTGNVQAQVYFELENYYKAGQVISIITFSICLLVLLLPFRKKTI